MNYYSRLISLQTPKIERQRLLEKNFHFICNCPACSNDWLPPITNNLSVKIIFIFIFLKVCYYTLLA